MIHYAAEAILEEMKREYIMHRTLERKKMFASKYRHSFCNRFLVLYTKTWLF